MTSELRDLLIAHGYDDAEVVPLHVVSGRR